MNKVIYLLLALALSACSAPTPDVDTVRTAIAQTQESLPIETIEPTRTETIEPTPTVIQLEDINLSEIIFLPGDLPAGFDPSKIRSGYQEYVVKTELVSQFHQDLEYQDDYGGRVSIYLFIYPQRALKAYTLLKNPYDKYGTLDISNLGENSFGYKYHGVMEADVAMIVFQRCNVMVVAEIASQEAYAGLIDYAKRLDERLTLLICPPQQ